MDQKYIGRKKRSPVTSTPSPLHLVLRTSETTVPNGHGIIVSRCSALSIAASMDSLSLAAVRPHFSMQPRLPPISTFDQPPAFLRKRRNAIVDALEGNSIFVAWQKAADMEERRRMLKLRRVRNMRELRTKGCVGEVVKKVGFAK
ncbi:hypothetical protein BT69DRAFT_1350933 [Atractiella rhizophila]|nr:hypothetical protein BT69DRAFT_1350933 [Atractiella rhizophila]